MSADNRQALGLSMADDFTRYKDVAEATTWIAAVEDTFLGFSTVELEVLAEEVTIHKQNRLTIIQTNFFMENRSTKKRTAMPGIVSRPEPWVGIICDGMVVCTGEGTVQRIAELKVGDMVGVMSLVSDQPEHIDLKVPGSKGVVLLAFTYNALHDLNNRLPDLGLKLYQLFGRTAYSYLESMLVRISGPEEFNGSNSAASREEATALLRQLVHTRSLFGTAYRVTDKDCELMVRDAKVLLPAPGDAVLLRGKRAQYVLLVLAGQVDEVAEDQGSKVLREYRPGDLIGEVEFVRAFKRSTASMNAGFSVVRPKNCFAHKEPKSCANEPICLLAIQDEWLIQLHEDNPEMCLGIYLTLVKSAQAQLLPLHVVLKLQSDSAIPRQYSAHRVSENNEDTIHRVKVEVERDEDELQLLLALMMENKCWKNIPDSEAKLLGRIMKMLHFSADAELAVEDEASNWLAIVITGQVSEVYSDGTQQVYLSGDLVGHVSFFWSTDTRTGRLCTNTYTVLAVLHYAELLSLYYSSPETGTKLMRALSYAAVELLKGAPPVNEEQRVSRLMSLLGDPEMQMYYPEDMQKALQSKPTPDEVEQTLNLIWEATTNDPSESNMLVEWDQVQNLSFASVARLLAVEKDELVLMQGQEGVALMVVLDGWLERRESLESTEVIERYGIGACVGGSALLNRATDEKQVMRDGMVYVSSEPDMVAATVTMEQLHAMNHQDPELARDLFFVAVKEEICRLKERMESMVYNQQRHTQRQKELAKLRQGMDSAGATKHRARRTSFVNLKALNNVSSAAADTAAKEQEETGEHDDDDIGAGKPKKKRIQRRLSDPGGGGGTESAKLAAARAQGVSACTGYNNKPEDVLDAGNAFPVKPKPKPKRTTRRVSDLSGEHAQVALARLDSENQAAADSGTPKISSRNRRRRMSDPTMPGTTLPSLDPPGKKKAVRRQRRLSELGSGFAKSRERGSNSSFLGNGEARKSFDKLTSFASTATVPVRKPRRHSASVEARPKAGAGHAPSLPDPTHQRERLVLRRQSDSGVLLAGPLSIGLGLGSNAYGTSSDDDSPFLGEFMGSPTTSRDKDDSGLDTDSSCDTPADTSLTRRMFVREPSRLGMPPAVTLDGHARVDSSRPAGGAANLLPDNTSIPCDIHPNADAVGTGNLTDVVVSQRNPQFESVNAKHDAENSEGVVPAVGRAESPPQSTSSNAATTQGPRKNALEGKIVEDIKQTKQFMSRRDVDAMGDLESIGPHGALSICQEAEPASAKMEEIASVRGAEDLSAGVVTHLSHEAAAQLGCALPSATEHIGDGMKSILAFDQVPTMSVPTIDVPEVQVQAKVQHDSCESQPIMGACAPDHATELTGTELVPITRMAHHPCDGDQLHGTTAQKDETDRIPDKKSCLNAMLPGTTQDTLPEPFQSPPVHQMSIQAALPMNKESPEQGSPPIAEQASKHMEEPACSKTQNSPAPVKMAAEAPAQEVCPTLPVDKLAMGPSEQQVSGGDVSSRSSLGESPDSEFEIQGPEFTKDVQGASHTIASDRASYNHEAVQLVGREKQRELATSALSTPSATPALGMDDVDLNAPIKTHTDQKPEAQIQAQQHGLVCKVGTERGGSNARSMRAETRFARGGGAASSSSSKALARAPRRGKQTFQPFPHRRAPGPAAAQNTDREPFRNTPFPIERRAQLGPPPMWPPSNAPDGGWFPPAKNKGALRRLPEQCVGEETSPRHSDHSRSSGHRSLPDLDAAPDVLPPINAPLHGPVLAVPQHQSIFETDRRFPLRPGARHREDRDSAHRRSLSPQASTWEGGRFDTADGRFPILEGPTRDSNAPPSPQSAPAHQPTSVHATFGYTRPRKGANGFVYSPQFPIRPTTRGFDLSDPVSKTLPLPVADKSSFKSPRRASTTPERRPRNKQAAHARSLEMPMSALRQSHLALNSSSPDHSMVKWSVQEVSFPAGNTLKSKKHPSHPAVSVPAWVSRMRASQADHTQHHQEE